MQQIVDFNEQLKKRIIELENDCIQISKRLEESYDTYFQKYGVNIEVDLIRSQKGKNSTQQRIFEENYESFIEIGIEKNGEYFPNAYIPIWKCKKDMFHLIGYLTKADSESIEKKIIHILQEMLQEKIESL